MARGPEPRLRPHLHTHAGSKLCSSRESVGGVNPDLDEKECEPSARLFHMSSSCCVRRRLSEMEESDPEKRGQKRPDQVK